MQKVIHTSRTHSAANMCRLARKPGIISPFTFKLKSIAVLTLFLGLLSLATLSGTLLTSSSAHAETLDYNVNVEPALNVTIPTDTISLLLDPTNKTFSSQELNISVGTNNPYGYRLTMSSTGTSLIHTEESSYTIPTLPALDGGYNDDSFIADKWGYKQDSSAWNSYTPGVTLLESNAPVNNDNTNLSFGAKIDYNQAPGNYTLVLNFNAVAKVATNDLVITFAGEGVNSVKVCKVAGDCTGDNLVGTVSTSGSSVPGLEDGSTYYLYPIFTSGHEFVSWAKTSTAGTISATDTLNPTFTMSDEPASVTITGKAQTYTITLAKTNATAIKIDGTSYTDSSATLTYGTHTISGTYPSGYVFSSWSTSNSTNLAITSTTSASTTITVHGAATLTLTGKIGVPTVIIKNVSNMTKVSLNDTECTSTSGCTISGLASGKYYKLKAYYTTTNRRFTGWTVSGNGSVSAAANAETTFVPTDGTITITPSIDTSCTAISSSTYMDNFSPNSSYCDSGSLTDRRDNQIYTVARLNGSWWMTRNLAIGCNGSGSSYGSSVSSKYLTSTYSNVSSSWSTPTALLSAASSDTQKADYTTPRMQCSSTYGAWYNYAAASAGTITGDSNNTDATKDICPAGWRLPTSSERGLVLSYSSAFSPVAGGEYADGSLIGTTTTGFWWSATAADTTLRHGTGWIGSLSSLGSAALYRYRGYYVRCIRS